MHFSAACLFLAGLSLSTPGQAAYSPEPAHLERLFVNHLARYGEAQSREQLLQKLPENLPAGDRPRRQLDEAGAPGRLHFRYDLGEELHLVFVDGRLEHLSLPYNGYLLVWLVEAQGLDHDLGWWLRQHRDEQALRQAFGKPSGKALDAWGQKAAAWSFEDSRGRRLQLLFSTQGHRRHLSLHWPDQAAWLAEGNEPRAEQVVLSQPLKDHEGLAVLDSLPGFELSGVQGFVSTAAFPEQHPRMGRRRYAQDGLRFEYPGHIGVSDQLAQPGQDRLILWSQEGLEHLRRYAKDPAGVDWLAARWNAGDWQQALGRPYEDEAGRPYYKLERDRLGYERELILALEDPWGEPAIMITEKLRPNGKTRAEWEAEELRYLREARLKREAAAAAARPVAVAQACDERLVLLAAGLAGLGTEGCAGGHEAQARLQAGLRLNEAISKGDRQAAVSIREGLGHALGAETDLLRLMADHGARGGAQAGPVAQREYGRQLSRLAFKQSGAHWKRLESYGDALNTAPAAPAASPYTAKDAIRALEESRPKPQAIDASAERQRQLEREHERQLERQRFKR